MKEKYEQLELDTRDELQQETDALTTEAISVIRKMTVQCHEGPDPVRNRHEAYGHAAEQQGKVTFALKRINKDTDELLNTLSDPNRSAIEAVSATSNSYRKAASVFLTAAAEMERIRDELYSAETGIPQRTPLDELVASAEFQEAEPTDGNDAAEE